MPRKTATKKTKATPEVTPQKGPSFFDYLRFGESYTSLILGIIVVIVATALLLSFVHNKSVNNKNVPISQEVHNTADISQRAQQIASKSPKTIVDTYTSVSPVVTIAPTHIPTATPKPKPEVKPTKAVERPKVIAKANPTPTPKSSVSSKFRSKNLSKSELNKIAAAPQKTVIKKSQKNNQNASVWVVQKGESLWIIAEKKYTSGYNWVDIARANNLSNPSSIHVGDRLVLPSVTPKATTIAVAPTPTTVVQQQKTQGTVSVSNSTVNMSKITGNTYTVQKGDNLWNIAVRAYGDGFRWGDIAKANNLTNPHDIFSGNVLTIPRP